MSFNIFQDLQSTDCERLYETQKTSYDRQFCRMSYFILSFFLTEHLPWSEKVMKETAWPGKERCGRQFKVKYCIFFNAFSNGSVEVESVE